MEKPPEHLSAEDMQERYADAQFSTLHLSWNDGVFRWREETWGRMHDGSWVLLSSHVDVRTGY